MIFSLSKNGGVPIMSWQEWTPPKKEYQWKEGRSAMELTKAWFRDSVPAPPKELLALLDSDPRFDGFEFLNGTPERIDSLLSVVDPELSLQESAWSDLRYQLLTALCGTVIQAESDGSDLAVLVVHEFRSNHTSVKKHQQNHFDFENFLSVISGQKLNIEVGKLYGCFEIGQCDLLVGKVISAI